MPPKLERGRSMTLDLGDLEAAVLKDEAKAPARHRAASTGDGAVAEVLSSLDDDKMRHRASSHGHHSQRRTSAAMGRRKSILHAAQRATAAFFRAPTGGAASVQSPSASAGFRRISVHAHEHTLNDAAAAGGGSLAVGGAHAVLGSTGINSDSDVSNSDLPVGDEHGLERASEGLTHEHWFELFIDLAAVATCFKLGEVIFETYVKYDVDVRGLFGYVMLLFAILFQQWSQLEVYLTRYFRRDVTTLAFCMLQMTSACGMGMTLTHERELLGVDSIIRDTFATSVALGKGTLALMYLLIVAFVPRLRPRLMTRATCLLLSAGGFIGSMWLDHKHALLTWAVSIGIDVVGDLTATFAFAGHPVESAEQRHHSGDRYGNFAMLVLGESVLQLVIPPVEQHDFDHYGTAFFSGLVVLNLAVLHFEKLAKRQTRAIDAHATHAVRGASAVRPQGKLAAAMWSYLHFPMCFALLVLGVGIKAIFKSKSREAPEHLQWLIASTSGAALAIMSVMRAMQQGLRSSSGRPLRRVAKYAARVVLAALCAASPLLFRLSDVDRRPWVTLTPVVAITGVLVFTDLVQMQNNDAPKLSGADSSAASSGASSPTGAAGGCGKLNADGIVKMHAGVGNGAPAASAAAIAAAAPSAATAAAVAASPATPMKDTVAHAQASQAPAPASPLAADDFFWLHE